MIKISTPLFLTEDEEKIKKSLESMFGISFKKKGKKIVGETKKINVLVKIKQKVDESRIKNTVLCLIEKNKIGNSSKLELNKQTFMLGKIHFVEEDYPLGNITIEFDDVENVVDYLTT